MAMITTGLQSQVDTLSKKDRSARMALVKGRDTGPEKVVGGLLRSLGYRFQTQGELPGRPDFVFTRRKAVVFVHGCFWHRHQAACPLARLPKSRLDFWIPKLEGNRRRDRRYRDALRKKGWRTLVVWECQLRDEERIKRRLRKFLSYGGTDESR